MEISFENIKVRLSIFNTFQHPQDENECFFLDIFKETIKDSFPCLLAKDPLEACLTHFRLNEIDTQQYVDEVNALLDKYNVATIDFPPWRVPREPLPLPSSTPHIPSLESLPKLKLKPLPNKLKYAFLGLNDTLLVIIASNLQKNQDSSLLNVLRKHKEAIGWTVTVLKGIDPSIRMHHIHLEDDARPFL